MKDNKCQLCKQLFDASEAYEYRGFVFCETHFDEGIERVDQKRSLVMEVTEKSVSSQRRGEFVNNRHKYNFDNVAGDGLPIIPINEPLILKEYEKGEL